ncbi:MAG: CheB methylesterase [Labilithrix sp.]|nr:CheB methylesterase [Labilithrix sp.]
MPKRDIIVIGASAGGVEALKTVISRLPATLPAAVLVVLHLPGDAQSALPSILVRSGRLPALHPYADAKLKYGTVYVAPPDHHLTLRDDLVHLSRGPRINGHRPAVDPLFQTAARAAGPRVIGVVLSGALDDGSAGMLAVKVAGGITVVQDPSEALYDGMPRSVLEQMEVDHVLCARDIASTLVELAGSDAPERRPLETDTMSPIEDLETELLPPGDPEAPATGFTCPECHGAIWRKGDGPAERYRCRVGHAYTPKGLFAAQSEAFEEAIWTAYRALEESASLSRRLAERARRQDLLLLAERYERRHTDAQQRADVIRAVLERGRLDVADRNGNGAVTAPASARAEATADSENRGDNA